MNFQDILIGFIISSFVMSFVAYFFIKRNNIRYNKIKELTLRYHSNGKECKKDNEEFIYKVKLGDKIKVRYLNNGKEIDVHIVETDNYKNEFQDVQKIYFRSPLAISLIGNSKGDKVKVGSLDNYVEILEILNSKQDQNFNYVDNIEINPIRIQKNENLQTKEYFQQRHFNYSSTLLPIELNPSGEEEFKRRILIKKKAYITKIYANGAKEKNVWRANNFRESSGVFGNLRSRPEFRQGEWQKRGIIKVYVSINE